MAINWETVVVAIVSGVGAAGITNVIGPVVHYTIEKKKERLGWRRSAINTVRDYIPRYLENPDAYDPLPNSDGFTRLRPYINRKVVSLVERESNTYLEADLVRPRWAEMLLNELDRLDRKWGL